MRVRGIIRSFLTVLVLGGALVSATQPAAAFSSGVVAELSSWAYTDSVSPFTSFPNGSGDMPVGAWLDANDKRHISKSYFTFTLPPLRGARIIAAEVNARETAANDCDKPRSTELWLTDTDERPTWHDQPAEQVKLPGPGGSTACTGFLGWSAGDVVRQAVTAGQSKITLALRMSGDRQREEAFGRRYANNPVLFISYNFPPNTPTGLAFNGTPCAVGQFLPRSFQPTMSAVVTDPDQGESIAGQFALWPVEAPDQRFEQTSFALGNNSTVSVGVPDGVLVDDHTYEWTARAVDDDADVSAWAPSCRFTTDFTAPSVAPTVSAVPADLGLPWQFTFTANGVPDVVGFRYGSFDPASTFVAADQLGGSATITLTPTSSGPADLYVSSVDRAGNLSPVQRYHYFVPSNAPTITSTPQDGGNGVAREFTFTPHMSGVVSYRYRFNNGPETTIAAAADGTARVTLTPDRPDTNKLTVRSVTDSGVLSEVGAYSFFITGGPPPNVHSDVYPDSQCGGGAGIPGTFDFSPNMPNVVAYVYFFEGAPETVITARPDGTASITYTPPEGGTFTNLFVFSRSADGTVSEQTFYFFCVN